METAAIASAEVALVPESTHTSSHKSARNPRIELITRAERRRRWPVEQKPAIAAASLEPGASPTEVARQHGISTGQLYTWRQALRAAQPALARFARVEMTPDAKRVDQTTIVPPLRSGPPTPPACRVEIALPDGTVIRVDAQVDPRALRRILAVLGKR